MPQKTLESDYNEYKVTTDTMGTFVEGGDGYVLRKEQLNTGWEVEEYFEFTKKQEQAIFAYMSKKLGYDVEQMTNTYYVNEFVVEDGTDVIEALHEAIYVLFDKEISRWAEENYEQEEYGI